MIDVNTTANAAATMANGNMGMNNVPQISNNPVMDNSGISLEKEKEIRANERLNVLTTVQENLTFYCKSFYERNSGSRLSEEMVDGFLIRLYNVIRKDS
jgi:hypothetical protein